MKSKPLSYVGLVGSLMAVLGCAAIAQDTKYGIPNVRDVDGSALGKLMDLPKDTIVLLAITKDGPPKYFVPQGGAFNPVKVVRLPFSVGSTQNLEILELTPATSLTRLKFKHNPVCELYCDMTAGYRMCFYPC